MTRRSTPAPPTGRGTAEITPDGCPVEIYAALPHEGEADVVHAVVRPSGSVLDLGCGVGRIAEPLARLGHRVVGVDESASMLRYLRAAEPVHSSIEALELAERFDGVLLASTLVNTYDPVQRQALLRAARRHLAPDGVLVLQRLAPAWEAEVREETWRSGPVELALTDVVRHGNGVVSATVVHCLGDVVAEQDFSCRVLDDDALARDLADAGLRFGAVLTAGGHWVSASVA